MRAAIIGGSSSVGRVVIEELLAHGDSVLATYCERPLEPAPRLEVARLDLRDERALAGFARRAGQAGPLDALLFLSGVLPGKPLSEYDLAEMQQVLTINVAAQARLIALLLPALAQGAQVLLMSSISGRRGSYDPIYAASKAALVGLMLSLARWHGARARFNCLAPGLIEGSSMYLAMSEERREHHRRASPGGALATVAEIAHMIVDLLGPRFRHLNGAVIPLDGGAAP
jgi:3-oxoacyl-[acyl-carrier protein] reductase